MRNFGLNGAFIAKICPQATVLQAQKVLDAVITVCTVRGISRRSSLIATIATIIVESPTFYPIRELGDRAYFEWQYGNTLGELDSTGFPKWAGRGFIQLTHEENYRKMGRTLNLPLLEDPEVALEFGPAIEILIERVNEGAVPPTV